MKKLSLLMAPLASVALLASCAFSAKFGVFVEDGSGHIVAISKDMAAEGKDFVAELTIKHDIYTLPADKEGVTVNIKNEDLKKEQFTYEPTEDKKKAHFEIPGKYVIGVITITVSLID